MIVITHVVDIGDLISDNCHDVLLLLKESWLKSWVGCNKYVCGHHTTGTAARRRRRRRRRAPFSSLQRIHGRNAAHDAPSAVHRHPPITTTFFHTYLLQVLRSGPPVGR